MNKKLLFALLIPVFGMAQSQRPSSEILAKQLAAQTNTIARPAETESVLVCEPVDVPYNENFNSAVVPAMPDCTTLQNAGTGNDFVTATNPGYGFTSKVLRYSWNTTSPANAWFFTRGINMTAGTTYNISYKYGSAGANVYTEKLKVHIGMAASVAGMNAVPLIDHPLVNNNVTPITDNLQFSPDVTGVYYVGFNCYSNTDQFYLFVDDIAVTTTLATGQFDSLQFSYSPNPVKDVLSFSCEKNIDGIRLYNLLGQMVVSQTVNSGTAQVDMRGLPKGNYFVEVSSNNETKTVKVIKE